MDEKPPIPGHERLSMADQMRANKVAGKLRTDPVTGAVVNPRREFIKRQVAARAGQPQSQTGTPIKSSLADTEW